MKVDLDVLEATLESDVLLALVAEVRAAREWLRAQEHQDSRAMPYQPMSTFHAYQAYRAIVEENTR